MPRKALRAPEIASLTLFPASLPVLPMSSRAFSASPAPSSRSSVLSAAWMMALESLSFMVCIGCLKAFPMALAPLETSFLKPVNFFCVKLMAPETPVWNCLLKGRAEAVGLCSHLSELVADVVSGLLKLLAHVLRCRADVTGCGGSRCAHAAHRLAAILCADLRTVGCVVDAAEALLELFDVVNGIFGIETDSVCELSRVCQNTTSLYDEIAAPGRAAISYLGSIRLAT